MWRLIFIISLMNLLLSLSRACDRIYVVNCTWYRRINTQSRNIIVHSNYDRYLYIDLKQLIFDSISSEIMLLSIHRVQSISLFVNNLKSVFHNWALSKLAQIFNDTISLSMKLFVVKNFITKSSCDMIAVYVKKLLALDFVYICSLCSILMAS